MQNSDFIETAQLDNNGLSIECSTLDNSNGCPKTLENEVSIQTRNGGNLNSNKVFNMI